MAHEASRLSCGWTATVAHMKPILRPGFSSFIALAVFTSLKKDGDEVWRTRSSNCRAYGAISAKLSPWGGASTSLESGTRAAGWASQVGYQKERTSRRIW